MTIKNPYLEKHIKRELSFIDLDLPKTFNRETLLSYLLFSLGIVTKRDKKGIKAKILVTLLMHKKPLSADELQYLCKESRTTVLFHLKELMKRGLIEKRISKYIIREPNLGKLIKKLREDTNLILDKLESVAKKLDEIPFE
ncbi:MAG: winged helix-turn-helix domain-containing protein [Candidatus Woesearchaeota archaeon]